MVSTSITLFNRAVFAVYKFNFPSFVTLIQILVSLVYMYGLNFAGYMELGPIEVATAKRVSRGGAGACGAGRGVAAPGGRAALRCTLHAREFSSRHGCAIAINASSRQPLCKTLRGGGPLLLRAQVAPLALFWWLYVVSGVTALRYLNVPMFRCPVACARHALEGTHTWMPNRRAVVIVWTNFWARPALSGARVAGEGAALLLRHAPRAAPPRPPPRSVIRRSTTLLVVAGEFYVFNKRPSRNSFVSHAALRCAVGLRQRGSASIKNALPSAQEQRLFGPRNSAGGTRSAGERPGRALISRVAVRTRSTAPQTALLVMVGGAVVAGTTDLTFNLLVRAARCCCCCCSPPPPLLAPLLLRLILLLLAAAAANAAGPSGSRSYRGRAAPCCVPCRPCSAQFSSSRLSGCRGGRGVEA